MPEISGTGFSVTDEEFKECLGTLFSPNCDVDTAKGMAAAGSAFGNLAVLYLAGMKQRLILQHLRIDAAGFENMMRRFHRDAYGIYKFSTHLKQLIGQGKLHPGEEGELMR